MAQITTTQALNDSVRSVGVRQMLINAKLALEDQARILRNNNIDRTGELLSRRGVKTIGDLVDIGIEYSYPWYMAALVQPGRFTKATRKVRQIPTRYGNVSAPARLVYRIPLGYVQRTCEDINEDWHQKIIDQLNQENGIQLTIEL